MSIADLHTILPEPWGALGVPLLDSGFLELSSVVIWTLFSPSTLKLPLEDGSVFAFVARLVSGSLCGVDITSLSRVSPNLKFRLMSRSLSFLSETSSTVGVCFSICPLQNPPVFDAQIVILTLNDFFESVVAEGGALREKRMQALSTRDFILIQSNQCGVLPFSG